MLEELKKQVLDANLELVRKGLVVMTWGNASALDRDSGLMVIKPSGVGYDGLDACDMTVVDMDGNIVEGKYAPSSDTPTHIVLYRNFPGIGAIVHTHSSWATSFAQAGMSISAFGTTHADHFNGPVLCTRKMTKEEVEGKYEEETGKVIVETLRGEDPLRVPAVLVNMHGPFVWGKDCMEAVRNAIALEEVSKTAYRTMTLSPNTGPMDKILQKKHFERKHGDDAYYGQKNEDIR